MRALPHVLIGCAAAKGGLLGLEAVHALPAAAPVEWLPLYVGAIVGALVIDADHPDAPAATWTGSRILAPGLGGGVKVWNGHHWQHGRRFGPWTIWHGGLTHRWGCVAALVLFAGCVAVKTTTPGEDAWLREHYGALWLLLALLGLFAGSASHLLVDRLNPVRKSNPFSGPWQALMSIVAFLVIAPTALPRFG